MRKSMRGLLVALALAGLVDLQAGPSLAQERIGSAPSIRNQVEGIIGGASRAIIVDGDVYLNELVRTGDDGGARLVFLDDTNLNVGPRSEVTLDRFVYNPGRGTGRVVVRASQGVFRFVTGAQRPQNYMIQTPIATIGVRGTVFDLVVQPDRIVVILISGRIQVTTLQGRVVPVTRPGGAVTIYATGAVRLRPDWTGMTPPNFAALFGPVQIAAKPTPPEPSEPRRVTTRRLQAPPPREVPPSLGTFRPGRVSLGLIIGGAGIVSLPTDSTSGFYSGKLDGGAIRYLIGGQGLVDVARFGNSILSVGVAADHVSGASLQWTGLCGGLPCFGSGNLRELNVIGELKLTTPISPSDSVNVYGGAGLAVLWPSGRPTGIGGPSFVGSATAPAFRVGLGADHRLSDSLSAGFKAGVQFTGATEYDTTLPGERFRLNGKTEVIFGLTITYGSP
jgi:hypothetical protein